MAEQLLRLAQNTQDPSALIFAYRVWGVALYWNGDLLSALEHFHKVLMLYDNQQHQSLAFVSVTDSRVLCQGYVAATLWVLGYPDQALKRVQGALTLARELSHSGSLAYALSWAARLHQLCRDVQSAREQTETLIAVCTEQGLSFFLLWGLAILGWTQVEQGQGEEGMVRIRENLTTKRAIGIEVEETYWLVLLAEACRRTGQSEEGLVVVAEALDLIDKSELRVFKAELYRLKGELTLQKFQVQGSKFQINNPQSAFPNPQSEAEAYFLRAIEIAQKQQAKSWELRASTSLARLWQQQGKKTEAHKLLADVYNWFTEGFDTKDLQEAKALIEELN